MVLPLAAVPAGGVQAALANGNGWQLKALARHVAKIVGALLAAGIFTKVGVAQRLAIRLFILALRATTPAAVIFAGRNLVTLARQRGIWRVRRLLWYAVSAWSIAEAAFFVYIMQCLHQLNSQTTTRWQAVTTHSTEEKRRSSMERYLLALMQVSRPGLVEAGSSNGAASAFKKSAVRDLPESLLRRGTSGPLSKIEGSRPLLRRNLSRALLGSTGHLLGLGVQPEASVDDLLKVWDGHEISDEEFQRLKWLELASFFTGPERGDAEDLPNWLRRGNVEEWISHYWFRGATPAALEVRGQRQELRRLVDMVLDNAGLSHLPEGRNQRVQAFRIFSDPLPVLHRPLIVYAGTSLFCPLLTLQVMKWLGFRRERVGGLCYWKRPPRADVKPDLDLTALRNTPLVFVHGLGVGLVPYYLFIYRLSQRHSGDMYVPEFPFLAMAPWESVPSAREVVAQLQDMLTANGHTAAHFMGHSFGAVVIGWMIKKSPTSVVYTTLMEPAQFLMIKSEALSKVLFGEPRSCYQMLIRYFAFRELFTVNLLCRNFFWEQSTMWPEDLHVPAVVQLAGDDHIVQSVFVRRLIEHEKTARKQRKKRRKSPLAPGLPMSGSSTDVRHDSLQVSPRIDAAELLDVLWCEGLFHGEILFKRRVCEKLFSRMKQMVSGSS